MCININCQDTYSYVFFYRVGLFNVTTRALRNVSKAFFKLLKCILYKIKSPKPKFREIQIARTSSLYTEPDLKHRMTLKRT